MTNVQSPGSYMGKTAVDPSGSKIGTVGQVYLNDETGRPDWITVNTRPVRHQGELRAAAGLLLQR